MVSKRLGDQRGSTMIEVLIALLVVSLGLLGALKLQTEGVRQNADSRYTVLASTYAHDALDAITYDRMNARANWTVITTTSAPSALSGRAKDWMTNLQRDLPDGKASIGCDNGHKCTVTLSWTPPGRDTVTSKYEIYN